MICLPDKWIDSCVCNACIHTISYDFKSLNERKNEKIVHSDPNLGQAKPNIFSIHWMLFGITDLIWLGFFCCCSLRTHSSIFKPIKRILRGSVGDRKREKINRSINIWSCFFFFFNWMLESELKAVLHNVSLFWFHSADRMLFASFPFIYLLSTFLGAFNGPFLWCLYCGCCCFFFENWFLRFLWFVLWFASDRIDSGKKNTR